MEICVLSGKGGTGKTFVSTNLFNILENAAYLDCDVEEPNGHIYFKSNIKEDIPVTKLIPHIDKDKCDGCRKCVDSCKFKSLVMIGKEVFFFDEMCHSCGVCEFVCPQEAISEVPVKLGKIEKREDAKKNIYTGILNIGETSGTGIINSLLSYGKKEKANNKDIIVDCPPGSDCSVIESIQDADYTLIVTEPTIFGLHNMKMIVELLNIFDKKFGIIINKSFGKDEIIEEYAKEHNIKIIEKIPFDKTLGKINSEGELITNTDKNYNQLFHNIYNKIKRGYMV